MTRASNGFNSAFLALLASALTALILTFAVGTAYGANGSAKDQYVGAVPGAGGDQTPADGLAPVANDKGVVTPDSVDSASEKANEDSKNGDKQSGAVAGGAGDPPAGAVPPGTVAAPAAGSADSPGFTLTNFNSPAGAAAAGVILIAAGGAMLSLSRRRMGVKLPSAPPIE